MTDKQYTINIPMEYYKKLVSIAILMEKSVEDLFMEGIDNLFIESIELLYHKQGVPIKNLKSPKSKKDQLYQYLKRRILKTPEGVRFQTIIRSHILGSTDIYRKFLQILENENKIKKQIKHPVVESLYWPI